MTTYGVTPSGWVSKPLPTIEDEVDAGLRAILGESSGTDDDGKIPLESFAGQLKSLMVDGLAAQWDLQEAVYASLDPNKATGASQDAVCAITGTLRNAAQYSIATGTCIGTPLTSLEVGRVVTTTDTNARFVSATGMTIAAATAWSGTTSYVPGDVRTNSSRVYRCITAGTSAGAGGPTTTAADITDNTVHWTYLGEGTGMVHVPFRAESVGPVGASTGYLATIATPVSGWNAVSNAARAVVGAYQETNSALRARRDGELAAPGNTTVDAIRANILKVNEGSDDPDHEPPTACIVFFNDTDSTDTDGLPPHSVEILVQGGTTADIAQAIWDSAGAGTATFGTRSDSVVDSEGNTQTVRWTRPAEVPIYVTATARYDATEWPASSDDLVAQYALSALLTYGADYPIARDVRPSPLNAAFMRGPAGATGGVAIVPADPAANPVPGLLEMDPLYIGTAPSPVTTTQITITRRQVATFDSANCVITASSETP